jgi:transcriptional regulator with XRE-family HTH domain
VPTYAVEKSIQTPGHTRLAALLRQRRLDAGLQQTELAEKLGVSQTWVSKYENGERRLDLVQLKAVCGALGQDLRKLVAEWESV